MSADQKPFLNEAWETKPITGLEDRGRLKVAEYFEGCESQALKRRTQESEFPDDRKDVFG
jgi:hypothetical protein